MITNFISRISIWFFFILSISLPRCHICFFIIHISSFKILNIFILATLKFFSVNWSMWATLVSITIYYFKKCVSHFTVSLSLVGFDQVMDIMNDIVQTLNSVAFFWTVAFVLVGGWLGWIWVPYWLPHGGQPMKLMLSSFYLFLSLGLPVISFIHVSFRILPKIYQIFEHTFLSSPSETPFFLGIFWKLAGFSVSL